MYGYLPRLQRADGRMRSFVHRSTANKEEVGFGDFSFFLCTFFFLFIYLSCND